MARRDTDDVDPEGLGEYTPAVYARGPGDAERYVQLLADHGIDAVVDPDYSPPETGDDRAPETDDDRAPTVPSGVPVLVAKAVLEDAQAYIAGVDDLNGFIPNGEDEDDLDDEDLLPGREGPDDEDQDAASLLDSADAPDAYDQDDEDNEDDEGAEDPEEAH